MAIELVDRRELLYSSVAGDVLPTSNVIENTTARDTDGAVVDKIWDGAAWVISGLYVWKPGTPARSADLSEDGYENINHTTTGVTIGYLNELGVSGSPYVAYASMIIGQSNKNLSAGYSLIIGTFHDINNNGGAYNLVTGFFNKITATGVGADTGDVMVVAGKYNNMSGSGNVSLGGVDLQAGAPTRFFEVKGFGNFNFSWVGEEDLLGSLDGFGNLMHGYNNAIGPDAQFCAIIGGKAIDMSTLVADNVVVIGMNTFTPVAGLSEATYVNLLSVNKLRETPLVTNIGLDADGFIVGSTGFASITWNELVAKQVAGDVHIGDTYMITDQANAQILISGISPDGSAWYKTTDDFGVESAPIKIQ